MSHLTAAERWNTEHRPGTAVVVTRDDGSTLTTHTRSEAWMLGASGRSKGHTAVVLLEGMTGSYSLDRVQIDRLGKDRGEEAARPEQRPITASLVLAAEAGNCNGCNVTPPPTPPDRKLIELRVGGVTLRLCQGCASRVEHAIDAHFLGGASPGSRS